MSEWEDFLNDTKTSYQNIYDMISIFADRYKGQELMPSIQVRNLLLDILDEVDIMEDSAIGICDVIKNDEIQCYPFECN